MIVVRTEDICFGRPRIEGTRIEVCNLVTELKYANTIKDVVLDRGLSKSQIEEVVIYCKELRCQAITRSFEKYCSNCILSNLHESQNKDDLNFTEIDTGIFTYDKHPEVFILGDTADETRDELSGLIGWKIADDVWNKFELGNKY